MHMIFVGGTDGPGWYIGPDGKIHRIPGWNPEAMVDVNLAISALRDIARMKNPAALDLAKSLNSFVQKEIGAHVKVANPVVMAA
jgi:hypothetical protein